MSAPQFCCAGCRAVYSMLADAGLGGFYGARDTANRSVPTPGVLVEPGRYAHYDSPEFMETFAPKGDEIELHVDGAHCAACVWLMDRFPQVELGAYEARLDLGRSRLRLRWNPDRTKLSTLAERLHSLGYATTPLGAAADLAKRKHRRSEVVRLGLMGAVALNAGAVAAALYAGEISGDMSASFRAFLGWISLALAIPAISFGALPFYRSALAGLRLGVAHIDLPIALGVLGSFFASLYATINGEGAVYYDSITALVFLLLLGRFVQQGSQRAAMSRAELLAAMTPGSADKKLGDNWVQVPANTLRPGDIVRSKAGERLPVDGTIRNGNGHVDRSLLTGEDRPISVGPGDLVHAGTVSVGGILEIETLSAGQKTRLGRLVAHIDQAGGERAPIAQLADRISGYFVMAVLSLAVIGGVAWAVIDASRVFDVVVSLLVVTCPCALGMATPVALAVARGRAAAKGILARSTAGIERLARVQTLFFDKTGTLTEGRMRTHVLWLEDPTIRGLIGAVEGHSTHPIATAISEWAPSDQVATEVEHLPGRGIQGRVDGKWVQLGAPKWLNAGPLEAALEAGLSQGLTPVVCHVDGVPKAILGMGDRIRTEAKAAIADLQSLGLRVGLLSGDHPRTVAQVAEALGVDFWHGGQSPEQKAARVAAIPHAAMIGDGFNDAAALRAASVGIAVHGGADVAAQVADIHLTVAGPRTVFRALVGARKTLATIHRNLLFSLGYNLTFAGLALAGQISPLLAAVLMPISSLTVILHSVSARLFVSDRLGETRAETLGTGSAKAGIEGCGDIAQEQPTGLGDPQ